MKMKNSAILNVLQKNKQSSKLNNTGDKKWVHQPEALKSNHVVYLVKFLGCTEVDQPKGTDVIREGIRKLKFNQQLKKAEGAKPAKVELTVSVDGVTIQEPKSKRVMHKYPLHRISYCADDKLEKRFFSFIAKEAEEGKHVCFVFVSDKLAEEITLTIGQAFDLAYRRFLENQGRDAETRKQVILAQRKAQLAEAELIELRARLKDLAALVPSQELETYLRQKQIADVLEVSIPEENLKNLQLNGDASSTNSGSHDVINLISDFDLTRPSRADSSDEGVESNASSTSSPPPPPVPPRNNASPTTGDLLGEIDQFEGASPVVGPRLENLNWSDLEDFEAPPPAATSTGNGAVVNGFANGHHGLANGSPVKLTPPPSKNNSNPPPLPARNPVSASNSDLLSNIFNTTASSPSLPSLLSSGSSNGLSHSASSSSVVTSLHSPLSSSAVGGSSNNLRGFALPPPSMGSANPRNPFAASSGQNVAIMNGSSNKGGDDPFGMGEFNSTAPQPLAKIAAFADMKDGFSRGLVIEPQNFNEFSLESLDPLRN